MYKSKQKQKLDIKGYSFIIDVNEKIINVSTVVL